MGVELALIFCYGSERVSVISHIDTHKCFSSIYDELFKLDGQGIIPEKIYEGFLGELEISTSPYGDTFRLHDPKVLLDIIQKNMDKLAEKHEAFSNEGSFMYSELDDERVIMTIGMLEKLCLMNGKSNVKVGLHWF